MKNQFQCLVFTSSLVVLLAILWIVPGNVISKEKKKERGYLGVTVQKVEKKYRKKFDLKRKEGVQVSYVVDDSPADYADLERNDIILEFEGLKLKSPSHLTRLIRKKKPGEKISLKVIHDGKEKTLRVELAEYDDDNDRNVFSFFRSGPNTFASHFEEKPYLGVYLQELNEDLAKYFNVDAESGVLITEVEEDSPAEVAGIKPGDILSKIDEEEVESVDDAMEILSEYEPEDVVEISVIRSGSRKKMNVELDESTSGYRSNFFFSSPGKNRVNIRFPQRNRSKHLQEILEFNINDRMNGDFRKNIELQILKERDKNHIILEDIRENKNRMRHEIDEMKNRLHNRLIKVREGEIKIVSAEPKEQTQTVNTV